MASEFGQPRTPLTQDLSWIQWFSRVHNVVNAMQQSGTTAERPTSMLWIGRQYFDTSLGPGVPPRGLPIWVSRVKPSVVWIDAAGNVV